MQSLQNNDHYGGDKLLIAVDCIIFGFDGQRLQLLLFKREIEPFSGQWSLIGSFVKQEESLDQAASRVLFELTGLSDIYMDQLYSYGAVDRDPGARVVSIAYYALIDSSSYNKELIEKHDAMWFDWEAVPNLIFDHREMVHRAHEQLKGQARIKPVGFALLPEKFTLPQLLRLYEELFQVELDDRNFRKKIKATGLLERLSEKDKSSSRKGAYLYRFNRKKYQELSAKGFLFEI